MSEDSRMDAHVCQPGLALPDNRVDRPGRTPLDTPSPVEPPRLRRPDRRQTFFEAVNLEERLPADHRARVVWAVVEKLDLTRFQEPLVNRGSAPGRSATDPALLVALWLHATIENIGSARRLARLCGEHDAYRWLCGGVSVNPHTLSDFRVQHEGALDGLFTQLLTVLVSQDLVTVARLSQDGLRVRASAGASSFRRRKALARLQAAAGAHVQQVKAELAADDDTAARVKAARQRAANEKLARVERALAVLPELEAIKQHPTGKPSRQHEARVSTTDADARRMKLPGGAIQPAYNVQFATAVPSRAIVAVDVVNAGSDAQQSEPLRKQAERRTGRRVQEHLFDGGFVHKELITAAESQGVAIYAPLPANRAGQPCTHVRNDSPGVAAWRRRMTTPEALKIYHQRAATAETVNAETRTYRGLGAFLVRGLRKVRCVALWAALAYNVVHFGERLMQT
jgi:transposase